ncbi:ROK family transcriptional regulator [Marinilactibacillus kalidii]|uniref:ROK family transcriptional regulator n=1 Tax=Marinilactibacillus kalidii TaxID=2820274 RepID=UPI001ABE76D8|nr:ROK family transcriptional regulator [Marinilactibacillus kalidii]
MKPSTIDKQNKNASAILSEIINQPTVSRASISSATGLNKSTVSEVVKQLIEAKLIVEIGAGESSPSGGRKPIFLKINKTAGVSLSIDIRFDQISLLTAYLDGEVIQTVSHHEQINKQNIITRLMKHISAIQQETPSTLFGLIGITISIHGVVHDNQISFTPYFDLDEIDLVTALKQHLAIPIYIENEANLSALAESAFNTPYTHMVSFSVHTGIGAGVILNDHLYRGYKGRSGEIGHTVLYPGGIDCPCGNKGCFEQYCSFNALMKRYRQIKNDQTLTYDQLINHYHEQDAETIDLINRFSRDLSIGLMNVMGAYDPEVIFINSEITDKLPEILPIVEQHISRSIYNEIPVYRSELGSKASLYGCAVYNIKTFLMVDQFRFNV